MDDIPFIQCNSRYPLGEGGISLYEGLNRCQACTVQQDHTELVIEEIICAIMTKSLNICERGSSQCIESRIQKIKGPKEPTMGQFFSSFKALVGVSMI